MDVKIGPLSIIEKIPIAVIVNDEPCILSKDSSGKLVLFSSKCPHQHNIVSEVCTNIFRCPSHDWTFDPKTGQSINSPQSNLEKIPIKIKNNFIYAEISTDKITKNIKKNYSKIAPKITIVGSAALLIEWNGFNLLTDPWIEGTAVFDSWITYPPSGVTVNNLPKIDAIWISHEHSDHFHEKTLALLDKDIPVYVPEFDNSRLKKRVEKLGFKNVFSMQPNLRFSLNNEIFATSFSSGSVWNDHILYLELGGFTILNINDAGFNWNIRKIVHDIDLICIQFSPASGYPATWSHIDLESKLKLMKNRNLGMLNMLKQISTFCNAKYLLPFANFNELVQPEHEKYVKLQPKNRISDIIKYLSDSSIRIIDLLPGESWDGKNDIFNRKQNREQFFEKSFISKYLKEIYQKEKTNYTVPKVFDITHNELARYFKEFTNSKLTKEIQNYSLALKAYFEDRILFALIRFENGNVYYEEKQELPKAKMTMTCPGNIVQEIVRNDLSWDEISSGYWAEYSRNPDIYNIALWKLFHAPWKARKNYDDISSKHLTLKIGPDTSIADIIEKNGFKASKIFEKYGMYCTGCEASLGENIVEGCRIHGLTDEQTNSLITELSYLEK